MVKAYINIRLFKEFQPFPLFDGKNRITFPKYDTFEQTEYCNMTKIEDSINVLGEVLLPCSSDPLTGFYRDGCCNTGPDDKGMHTVCVEVTAEFLEFSKMRGNDLSTPRLEFGFPGLKPGDRWCLCADRWVEADAFEAAPHVILQSTHINTLEKIPFSVLRTKALDMN